MEASFEVTKEDLSAAMRFEKIDNQKAVKIRLIVSILLAVFGIFLLIFIPVRIPDTLRTFENNLDLYLKRFAVNLMSIASLMLGLIGLFFKNLSRKLLEKFIGNLDDGFHELWLLGDQKLIFDDEGLTQVNTKVWKYNWDKVIKAAVVESHIFIYLKREKYAIAIPKQYLVPGKTNEIISILKSHNVKFLRAE